MTTHQIVIIGSIPVTGELILEPPETMAEVGDEIEWILRDSEVYSFRIQKKAHSPNIFWPHTPSPHHRRREHGSINQFSGGARYRYSIYWRNKDGGRELLFDPIISVKPTAFKNIILLILGLIGTFLLAYLGWKKFHKHKK